MRTRLIPALLAGGLGATLALAQEPPGVPAGIPPGTPTGAPPGAPPGGGQPGKADRADDRGGRAGGMTSSIDGNWTVVSAARDGKAVDGADKMTVTIKGNVVTFAGGAEKNPMRAMRIEFGPTGTVRVAEANPDGKFDTPGTPGVGTPPDAGGVPPPAATGTPPATGTTRPGVQPGGPGAGGAVRPGGGPAAGTGMGMSGVYVLTPDYLAISVFEPGYASGTPPAGGTRPGDPPAGGVRPGGPGTTPPAPGAGTPPGGTQPGGTVGTIGGSGPELRSHVSVILRRAAGTGAPGTPPVRP